MSRETWYLIKHAKRFYVVTYRRAGSALLFSAFINLFLGYALYHVYFNQNMRDYYATSGVTPPVLLTSMDVPNYTSVALIGSDPDNENDIKVIPQ